MNQFNAFLQPLKDFHKCCWTHCGKMHALSPFVFEDRNFFFNFFFKKRTGDAGGRTVHSLDCRDTIKMP